MAQRSTGLHRRRARPAQRTRSNLPRVGLLVVGLVAGFALAFLLLTASPRLVGLWRERQFLTAAQESLKHGDLDAAVQGAHAALQFDSNSLAAFRVLAEATERQSRPETVFWRREIARVQPRDVDSQLNLASAALRFGQLDVARKALDAVPQESRESAPYNVVAGWLARAQGDEAGLERHFAAALKKEPTNETYRYNLAVVGVKSPDPQKSGPARQTLQRLAENPAFRAGALRALLNDAIQHSEFEDADRFAQQLQMNPQVTFSDYLLCLELYKKLDEKKFGALLDKVKPVAAHDLNDLALLLEWLNQNGLSAEVLRWTEKLPAEKTTNAPPAIEIAEALSSQKNWSRLRRWTRSGAWGEAEYLRLAYQAFATRKSHQAGADAEFGTLWHAAEQACADSPEREIRLARLASKWNLSSEAEQLWLRVAQNPLTRREALDALFEIYRANNDLPNLYLTAMRLHETSPNEPLLAAEFARLSLLLDHDTAEGQRIADEAFEQAPDEPLCIIAAALSRDKLGHPAEGIELLKKMPPDKLHQARNAVYAAVLLLNNNQPDLARQFIDAANAGPLFSEEKDLLRDALLKAQAKATPVPTNTPEPTAGPIASPAPPPAAPR